jgi:hypothetical protein
LGSKTKKNIRKWGVGEGNINLFPVLPVGGDNNNINNHEQRVEQSTIILKILTRKGARKYHEEQ